jgi:transposase
MFLRCKKRRKDGKEHLYWSVVENRRVAGDRVVQRHVLYLGELNGRQEASWRKTVELFGQDEDQPRQVALFPETHVPCSSAEGDAPVLAVRLSSMRLVHPRQWGACWLGCELWRQLGLDAFWREKLPAGRQGARWDQILQVLTLYRLIAPGSEWQLHRHWFDQSAMADLLGGDFGLAEIHRLYECHDKLLEHKTTLFDHLTERWRTLFEAKYEVLLYDLTSTYFESDPPENPEDIRRFGHSRDKRTDCVQVVIALIVTPEGFPIAYEVLPGNTADKTTLRDFLGKIQAHYGKAERVWVMDRGIPTEEILSEMRESDPPVSYLVGTPKGRLSQLEEALLRKPWRNARPSVRVKLIAEEGETYVLAESDARIGKERSMRRRRLRKYLKTLSELSQRKRPLNRDQLHQALGAAKKEAGRDARHVKVEVTLHGKGEKQTASLVYQLNRTTLRVARRREGRYLLRTNLNEADPAKLWEFYLQLTEVEQAFKELKGDLALRPIYHRNEDRIHAHIFVSFLAYCLQVTLKARLKRCASGLTPRAVLEKFAAIQMLDVHLPTTDGREIVITRYTQPEKELCLLLDQLKLTLPEQAPPKIHTPAAASKNPVVPTF